MKKFFNFRVVWIILAICAFMFNLCLAIIPDFNKSNLLTVISGWVGGISTIILGVITYRQNKVYTLFINKRDTVNLLREEYVRFLSTISKFYDYNYLTGFLIKLRLGPAEKNEIKELQLVGNCNSLTSVLVQVSNEVQTFNYMPKNKKNILVKVVNLIDYVNSNYYNLVACFNYDNKLHKKIMKILDDIEKWCDEFYIVKRQIKLEIDELIDRVNKCNNHIELEKLLVGVDFEIKKANAEIDDFRKAHDKN